MIHLIQKKVTKNSAYLGTNGFKLMKQRQRCKYDTETVSLTKKIKAVGGR